MKRKRPKFFLILITLVVLGLSTIVWQLSRPEKEPDAGDLLEAQIHSVIQVGMTEAEVFKALDDKGIDYGGAHKYGHDDGRYYGIVISLRRPHSTVDTLEYVLGVDLPNREQRRHVIIWLDAEKNVYKVE